MVNEDPDAADGAVRTEPGAVAAPRLSLDDLRLRLDSPLFARDPGLSPGAQVPHLRELTWDSVVNPTSAADAEPVPPVAAVLLVSSELDEILALSDRVIVMNAGRVAGELPIEQCSESALGRLMAGASVH